MGLDPEWDFTGSGDPNGVVTASPYQTYLEIAATPIPWVKASGVLTNTGWTRLEP